MHAGTAVGQPQTKVAIEGGPDGTGHNYEFRVTNHHQSPIVLLGFPHFRVDVFTVPLGWSTAGTTNAMGEGGPNAEGVCKATVPQPDHGIQGGQTAVFQLRVRPEGAWRGTGTVKVGFADGLLIQVPDVPLPQREPTGARRTRMIGCSALGVLFLVVLAIRNRRRSAVRQDAASATTLTDGNE